MAACQQRFHVLFDLHCRWSSTSFPVSHFALSASDLPLAPSYASADQNSAHVSTFSVVSPLYSNISSRCFLNWPLSTIRTSFMMWRRRRSTTSSGHQFLTIRSFRWPYPQRSNSSCRTRLVFFPLLDLDTNYSKSQILLFYMSRFRVAVRSLRHRLEDGEKIVHRI